MATELDRKIAEIENEGKIKSGFGAIDDLSGDDAKICGFSYYSCVYAASGLLIMLMGWVYFKTDEKDPVRKMALIQGSLTIGLMFSLAWF